MRPIKVYSKPKLKLNVDMIDFDTKESVSYSYGIGDIISVKYRDKEEIKTVKGSLNLKLVPSFELNAMDLKKSKTSSFYKGFDFEELKNRFEDMFMLTDLIIDNSTEYHSSLTKIPLNSIVELMSDSNSDTETNESEDDKKNNSEVIYSVELSTQVTIESVDGTKTSKDIKEDDFLCQLTVYSSNGRIIKRDIDVDSFVYNFNTDTNDVEVIGVIDYKTKDVVYLNSFHDFGIPFVKIENGDSVNDAIDEMNEKHKGELFGIIFGAPVATTFKTNGSIEIDGKVYFTNIGQPARGFIKQGNPFVTNVGQEITTLTDPIIIGKDAEVEFNGLMFTKNAKISINEAKSVTFERCAFGDIVPKKMKDFLITAPEITNEGKSLPSVKLVIRNCSFSDNPVNGLFKMYNLFESNFSFADGSEIVNSVFSSKVCTNNIINIYGIDDEATVKIIGNIFKYSCNAVRIGTVGNPNASIVIAANDVRKTSDDDWKGLCIIQPYKNFTKSMEKLYINFNNNYGQGIKEQLYFVYNTGKETSTNLTVETAPYVMINGKKEIELNWYKN